MDSWGGEHGIFTSLSDAQKAAINAYNNSSYLEDIFGIWEVDDHQLIKIHKYRVK
jgi:hypothetical protein